MAALASNATSSNRSTNTSISNNNHHHQPHRQQWQQQTSSWNHPHRGDDDTHEEGMVHQDDISMGSGFHHRKRPRSVGERPATTRDVHKSELFASSQQQQQQQQRYPNTTSSTSTRMITTSSWSGVGPNNNNNYHRSHPSHSGSGNANGPPRQHRDSRDHNSDNIMCNKNFMNLKQQRQPPPPPPPSQYVPDHRKNEDAWRRGGGGGGPINNNNDDDINREPTQRTYGFEGAGGRPRDHHPSSSPSFDEDRFHAGAGRDYRSGNSNSSNNGYEDDRRPHRRFDPRGNNTRDEQVPYGRDRSFRSNNPGGMRNGEEESYDRPRGGGGGGSLGEPPQQGGRGVFHHNNVRNNNSNNSNYRDGINSRSSQSHFRSGDDINANNGFGRDVRRERDNSHLHYQNRPNNNNNMSQRSYPPEERYAPRRIDSGAGPRDYPLPPPPNGRPHGAGAGAGREPEPWHHRRRSSWGDEDRSIEDPSSSSLSRRNTPSGMDSSSYSAAAPIPRHYGDNSSPMTRNRFSPAAASAASFQERPNDNHGPPPPCRWGPRSSETVAAGGGGGVQNSNRTMCRPREPSSLPPARREDAYYEYNAPPPPLAVTADSNTSTSQGGGRMSDTFPPVKRNAPMERSATSPPKKRWCSTQEEIPTSNSTVVAVDPRRSLENKPAPPHSPVSPSNQLALAGRWHPAETIRAAASADFKDPPPAAASALPISKPMVPTSTTTPTQATGASSGGNHRWGMTANQVVEPSKTTSTSSVVLPPSKATGTSSGGDQQQMNQSSSSTSSSSNTGGASEKSTVVVPAEQLPKASTLGIPMRWLKPKPKPKVAVVTTSKSPSMAVTTTATKTAAADAPIPRKKKSLSSGKVIATASKKDETAPASPLANRLVTDSEGGSTVSNARELMVMMEKKQKPAPKVPTAIVTKDEDVSMGSPAGTDDEAKDDNTAAISAAATKGDAPASKNNSKTTKGYRYKEVDSDEEPPLESDSDESSSVHREVDYVDDDDDVSDDDSDTDNEEVMLWASKMFGVPAPSPSASVTPSNNEMANEEKKEDDTESSPRKPLKVRLKLSPSKILGGVPPPSPSDAIPTTLEEKKRVYKKAKKAMKIKMRSEKQQTTQTSSTERPIKLKARGRPKLNQKSYLKKEPELTVEEKELDAEQERIEREEEKRIRNEAKPLTAAQIRAILGEDEFQDSGSTNWVRRSVRQPSLALLNSKPLKALVSGLKNNSPDMVVLKMKKYINDPDAPSCVLDAALEALEENTNCEALYFQNFNEGMRDRQVLHLIKILQSPTCKIWCLNIGENYNVETETWDKFTKGLRRTKITHMYASEHTITTEMKDEIRETIRVNRKKHDLHINPNNLDVIVQCTHCWWNPINAKSLRPYLKKKGYEYILNDKEVQGLRGSTSEAPSM